LATLVFQVMEVSANIDLALKRLNVSQAELARKLGVRQETLWRWYNRKCTPNAYNASNLAEYARGSGEPSQQ
jgi:transcriptional regulator with XRE-family HTH domain